MKHKTKTKAQLLNEVVRLRKRVKINRAASNKRAKTVLLPFTELYNLLFNSINDEIFIYEYPNQRGVPSKFLEVNGVACKQLEYTREELLQKNLYDIHAPETISHVEAMMKKLMTQKYMVWEGIHLGKNGRRIPVEVSNHLFELKGKPTVISAVKDITSRKQVEEAQKQIEQAVHESEHRFRTLAEASFEGVALTENGIIVDMNDQLAHMYEYEKSELVGKSLLDIVVPELRAHVHETIQLDKRESYEILGLRKNGTTFSAEVRGRITRMGGKELYISTIRDITERKQTEETFQHERNLLRTLIDSMPELINYKDTEGRYLLNNHAHLQSLGVEHQEDVLGKTMFDFHPAELVQRYYEHEMQVLKTGEAVLDKEEMVFHHDTGDRRWHLTSKVPLKDNQGRVTSIISISTDITDRKHYEDKIQHERTLLRTLIDNLPDAVFVKDVECRKIIANPIDIRYIGAQSEAEVIGKTDFDFFPADAAAAYYAEDQSVIQSGVPIINREGYIFDKQGNKLNILSFRIPLRNEHDDIIGVVGVTHDITEQKRMEETLRETADKFRFVFENAYDGLSIFEETPDRKHRRLIDCNKRYVEMAGRSREELLQIGSTMDIAKPLSEDNHESNIQDVVFRGSFSWIRPDGKDNVIEYTAVPIKVQGKTITIGIDRDITERKRIEEEREHLIKKLQDALADVKTLSGLVPICANCKQIRDDKGFWTQVESYIQEHSQAQFSHGICPDCMKKLYPEFLQEENE
jgi:PAS domain S-box/PAS domain S-box/PAS domain S-box/PAS domain S-box/PAS domain S-box